MVGDSQLMIQDDIRSKINNFATIQTEMNRIISNLFKNVKSSSIIVYTIDVTDLNLMNIEMFLKFISKKSLKVVFLINKVDLLPIEMTSVKFRKSRKHNIQLDSLLKWVKGQIKPVCEKYNINKPVVIFASASKLWGMKNLYHVVNELIQERKHHDPKVYFMGCTNAGKSSILNAIVSTSSRVSSRIRLRTLAKNPKSRWANRTQSDPSPDLTLEELLDIISTDRFLTESEIPGTTVDFNKVRGAKKIHAKV